MTNGDIFNGNKEEKCMEIIMLIGLKTFIGQGTISSCITVIDDYYSNSTLQFLSFWRDERK